MARLTDLMRQLAHPEWGAGLGELKRAPITPHGDDREAYVAGRDALVRKITALAMEGPAGLIPPR
jgi:hypothetical protein